MKGEGVSLKTVKHLVKEDKLVKDLNYSICLNEDCDVVYYSDDVIYKKEDVKVPVWFKRDANPKYICYCSRVTEEDIKRAIEDGANTLKDVIIKTGAMKNCNCEINNPKGKCCSNDIKKVMEKYMGI